MIEWETAPALIDYPAALERMHLRVDALRHGQGRELVWLVEHAPLYTAGTSAKAGDLLPGHRFPVYDAGRGGQFTYHGPGQRVAYIMIDLKNRGQDIRAYVKQLEGWIIAALAEFGVEGFTREGRIGVWVHKPAPVSRLAAQPAPATEAKIAALGIRVQGWVTSHGIAINVNPDLGHYAGIVPCGIQEYGVTSLADLGVKATMQDVDDALRKHMPFVG
jgi:lipoyl(octanoyl) transferase